MSDVPQRNPSVFQAHCCPCADHEAEAPMDITRRGFLESASITGLALGGLSWSAMAADESREQALLARRPLVVKPILLHRISTRAPQRSWRIWGGLQTQEDADQEAARIREELARLQASADFPVRFLPVSLVRNAKQLDGTDDLSTADVLLLYAAGDYWFSGFREAIAKLGKDTVVFSRFLSGPLYS